MRRLFTALIILLVVLAAGMSALVLLINPNDFRDYMVRQVEARTGYRLTLSGELRWHVWPQLSILSGGMSLSAPGAAVPVVSAENMRLDVKLWPLLSHQLEIRQVMLKDAVVRLTTESEARKAASVPIAPAGSPEPETDSRWHFDLGRVEIVDSLLVFQRGDSPPINVRDINLTMESVGQRQVQAAFSSRINRDQRELSFAMKARLDMQAYPQQVAMNIASLDYQLQGAGVPPEGIRGQGSMQVNYQRQPESVTIGSFSLTANNSALVGSASAVLGAVPDYQLTLKSERLDVDTLLGLTQKADGDAGKADKTTAAPVISREQTTEPDQALRDFRARVAVAADKLIYRGVTVDQFNLQGDNQRGKLDVSDFSGRLGDGRFSLPTTLEIGRVPAIIVSPLLQNIEVSQVLHILGLPDSLSGRLSLQGSLSGDALSLAALISQWRGKGSVQIEQLRLPVLNIQQLIQQAVARNNVGVQGQDSYSRFTEIRHIGAQAVLNRGQLQLQDVSGESDILALTGSGQFDLPAQQCDINLDVKVMKGWAGDEQMVQMLQDTAIPFRLYGDINNLNYQLQVDQLVRKRLQDELKKRLGEWSERIQQPSKG
ncbi:outer membrane assembly protein AsmA [Musicola paradisiaca]|uniref:AsmA family protein n=1 Tax=Musicola paradisiaca (strain Ech703) TaxID=579405 RepID=C6CCW2_MUSP7|nr:outer membrane assembly protein AsmA [Musicola paradisiaca]ACS85003.1 AsmA family protein [Musicola paradisiaca Ech703]